MKRALIYCLTASPLPLAAHPHIFVDTGFEVVINAQNQLTHIRVSWSYDDLYSLLLAEDFEIDQDGDGMLTPKEEAILTGFDMQWIPGYSGDLDARLSAATLTLSGPTDYTATMLDGIITTTHLRAVTGTPEMTDVLALKPYDPTYYTAYEVTKPITVTGPGDCSHQTVLPDIDAALKDLQVQLSALGPDSDPEAEGFPEMGEKFSSTVEISCPAL